MDDQGNTPADAGTASLTVDGLVNQLVGERRKEQDTPQAPVPQSPEDDGADPADLAALEASEAEQPEATQSEQPPKLRLKDGYEATFDEIEDWRKGTLRQADYTKKTQELAEQRKKFETDTSQFQQHSQTHAQAIDSAIAIVQHFMPKPPDDELRKQDFFAWQEQKAEYESQAGKLQSLMHQKAQFEHVEGQKRQQALQEHYRQQQETLYAARPELKDPVKATKFWEEIKTTGTNLGFTVEEMSQISDSRLLLLADKATRYDRLMAAKAKLADKAKDAAPMPPPAQSPQRRVSPAERASAEVEQLKAKADKSGDLRDLAAVIVAERRAAAR